jgi:2-oxoglutarate dehydrogenase E2 component (dihydrolipoamide succinyltransferase)
MTIEIRVPQLPESVADATLVAWRKQPGEAAGRDENLADLETDKVVLEVPAPAAGVIKELKVQPGTTVKSGDLLAIFEEGAAAKATPVAAAAAAATTAAPARSLAAKSASAADVKAGPAARRVAAEQGVDLGKVTGSGLGGAINEGDVLAQAAKPQTTAAAPVLAPAGARQEQRVPMTRLRQRIAERLVQAQHTAALLTTFNEVDLSAVNELRARHKDRFEKTHGAKLGFMSFFVKASIEALREFPVMNASVDGTDIIYHEFLRHRRRGLDRSRSRRSGAAQRREHGFCRYREADRRLTARGLVRDALGLDDLQGGTFTITNGGTFGSLLSTPIVECTAERDSRHAQDSGSSGRSERSNRRAPDDVSRARATTIASSTARKPCNFWSRSKIASKIRVAC